MWGLRWLVLTSFVHNGLLRLNLNDWSASAAFMLKVEYTIFNVSRLRCTWHWAGLLQKWFFFSVASDPEFTKRPGAHIHFLWKQHANRLHSQSGTEVCQGGCSWADCCLSKETEDQGCQRGPKFNDYFLLIWVPFCHIDLKTGSTGHQSVNIAFASLYCNAHFEVSQKYQVMGTTNFTITILNLPWKRICAH